MPQTKPPPLQTERDPMTDIVLERRRIRPASVMIGILGTILLHLLLWLIVPADLFKAEPGEKVNKFREFSIELEDPVEEEPPPVYTQTNPDVPENEPDETNRFAARSQQAANEELPEEIDPFDRPAVESDDIIETDQFLSGSLAPPEVSPPSREPAEEETQEEQEQQVPMANQPLLQRVSPSQQAQRKEITVMGSQEDADPDETGIAELDFDQLDEAPTNITDLLEGEEEEGEEERQESPEQMASSGQMSELVEEMIDGMPTPRARPKLPRVPAGPVRNSRAGVTAVGNVAVDAKASKFGEYMERLIETVQINWDTLAQRSSHIERNSMVKIRFVLSANGYVSDMEILEGTTSRAIGIYMCREAIESGSPYGPWPEGLVEVFGQDEDLTFEFHYY